MERIENYEIFCIVKKMFKIDQIFCKNYVILIDEFIHAFMSLF